MNQSKQGMLQEVLKGISDMKELGLKSLSCPDISPWGFDDASKDGISKHITTELDKLGYKLYAFHYAEDGKPTGEPSGLQIHWE